MTSVDVTLTSFELYTAANVGIKRRVVSLRKGYKETNTPERNKSWQRDIEGACAEMAFAKATGMYWDFSVNTFKSSGDVGDIEIRSTQHSSGDLIIRDHDPRNRIYVLVTGQAPHYSIRGWADECVIVTYGQSKAPNGRQPALFISQYCLNPLSTLAINKVAS